jgi:hypothetical protein
MISERMMQNYLDEFCYKLTRRYLGEKLFDRLIVAAIYPYWHVSGYHISEYLLRFQNYNL